MGFFFFFEIDLLSHVCHVFQCLLKQTFKGDNISFLSKGDQSNMQNYQDTQELVPFKTNIKKYFTEMETIEKNKYINNKEII